MQINVRETRRDNQELTIQRHGQIGHTRHRTKTNNIRKNKQNTTQHMKNTFVLRHHWKLAGMSSGSIDNIIHLLHAGEGNMNIYSHKNVVSDN